MSTKTHINARQIKAARALLDWSQEDLAAASGLSIATIRKIESGAMSPRDKTMGSIVSALEEANIEFTTPDGVRLKDQNIMVIEGVDCFLQLTEDIYYTMKGCGSDCIRFMNGDSSRMNSIEWASLVKLRKASMRFRILIKEGNTNLHLPLDEYRWVPAAYFRYNLLAIYKNKVAISVYEKDTQQDMHKVIVSHATKTFSDRARSILSKQERLAQLDQIRVFTYNPNGENLGKDSLNHSEVIKIGASFLTDKPTMQRILVNRFPVLLIDESQDTNKLLMESFFAVQNIWKQQFCLGLFGDMMQRIYADGKPDLGRNLPPDWARPAKTINHRSPKRIIRLINKIRAAVDEQEQKPRSDKEDGWVRIFILPSATEGKPALERKAANHMQTVTGDPEWQNNGEWAFCRCSSLYINKAH